MKKVFTLFALLLTIVIGAKANQTDLIAGVTLPDVPTGTLNLASQTDFIADDNGWIVFEPNGDVRNASKTWFNALAWNTTSATVSDVSSYTAPFKTLSSTSVTTVRKTERTKNMKFTGAEKLSILGSSSNNNRRLAVSVFSISNNTQTLVETKYTPTGSSFDELLFENLSASTTYVAYFYSDIVSGSDGNTTLAEVALQAPQNTSEVTDISLDGVKIDGSTATETTDYTISGTNITLTGSYSIAPEVSLIEKTTYDEGDPTTKDIDVTLTKGEAYFTGTATIGAGTDYETEYTVQVPVSTAASLEASVASATVTSPKIATGTSTFNVVGANLTGTTVDLAFASAVDGLTVSPASIEVTEGAVNQEVTISYYSTEDVAEANVNLTITSSGVDAITIPVTYSSTAGVTTITDVTESTTWDFAATGKTANVDSPDADAVVPFANVDGWASTFDAAALAGKAQYFLNSGNKCFQGSILKFHTTYPGTIQVDFSNTGSASSTRPYRYLQVNGVVTEYKSKDANKISTGEIAVAAGDVELIGIMGTTTGDDCEPTDVQNMLRIYKVVFTADNGKEDSDLTVAAEASVNIDETEDVVYTTSSTGAVSVESSAPAIATATVDQVNKTITITGVAAGTATITVSQEADDSYNAGSQEIAVTVINPNVKYVYDATGLSSDEFVLTKDNIGGDYGTSENNQFVTVSTNNWNNYKTYGGYTGDFYNMSSTDRKITFKVKGAENFKVYVQNNTEGRPYTVKIGDADAVTVNHGGAGAEYSELFETGTTDEVTITLGGGGNGSVYPIAIKFNIPATENIAFSGVTTYVTKNALDFSEVTELSAYAVTQIKTTSVATEKVGQVPAGTPLLIKAEGAVDVDVPVIDNAASIMNLLLASDGAVTGGDNIFAYSKNDLKFKKVSPSVTIPAGKAYLDIEANSNTLDIDFDGEATGVNGVAEAKAEVAPVKVIKNGQLFIGNFNVAGQQVK